MPRIVLDCNVFVSALLSPQGTPAQILDQWADGDFDLVVSPLLLAEMEQVLSRLKFHASIDTVHIDALLTGLVEDARMSGSSWNFGGGPHGLMVKR